MRRLFSLLAFSTAILASPSLVRADLPPPDGTKFVDYQFRIDGLSKFPDYVILVYPWSTSNGAPTKEHTIAKDGAWVSVGRRSYPPKLYAVKPAALDEFLKTYKPAESFNADPAMEGFLAKTAACDLAPSADFSLPTSDPRDTITEIFTAASISDSSCHLTKGGEGAANGGQTPPVAESAPKSGGCAGCAVGERGGAPTAALLGMLIGALGFRKRQKRKS